MARICIVAHFAFGALKGGLKGHIGGVEWQTSLLSKWLAARGHHVSLVTWDEGQEDDSLVEGVRLIKLCRQDEGISGLRFFYPRWTSLNRALCKANADLYYQNCAEYVTGQVALWCYRHSRKFVYSVASDPDCDAGLPAMSTMRDRLFYKFGLRHADLIITQTNNQKKMLLENFGLFSVVLPMPCPGPSSDEFMEPDPYTIKPLRVIWAGRIAQVKRLEFLFDVAARLPQINFEVAGGFDANSAYGRRLKEAAKGLPNVILLGRVERKNMPEFYKNAFALCCTSVHEGFPNTFIEAWSYGIPVISTIDPDNLINSLKLGMVVNDVSAMSLKIDELAVAASRWQIFSKNARAYYLKNHFLDDAMMRFETIFHRIAGL